METMMCRGFENDTYRTIQMCKFTKEKKIPGKQTGRNYTKEIQDKTQRWENCGTRWKLPKLKY